MSIVKQAKDNLLKLISGKEFVPAGLVELQRYARTIGGISFKYENGEGGRKIAISTNFRYGSIITSGSTDEELDKNIKDAILTSFEIPSSYAREAQIEKTGDHKVGEYAPA